MSGIHVLFLCTHNSARSIMAEALLNHLAAGRVRGYSAGSHPSGTVHPLALAVLQQAGIATDSLRSKDWDTFTLPDAPRMNLVITVCDQAAGEICPIWPGGPRKAHWGVAEPGALAAGKSTAEALPIFAQVAALLQQRIERFLALPLESLSAAELQQAAHSIAQSENDAE
ncbi:MAG: arsenate reductase ArsC [Magnetococcales bacterium]|nr:arsenate reductase ArsC [Magnetococcales bacterium]